MKNTNEIQEHIDQAEKIFELNKKFSLVLPDDLIPMEFAVFHQNQAIIALLQKLVEQTESTPPEFIL